MIIALLAAILGFELGYRFKDITKKLSKILEREPEPEGGIATPLPPQYADVNSTSAIVTPKSPDQIQREQEERIRSLV